VKMKVNHCVLRTIMVHVSDGNIWCKLNEMKRKIDSTCRMTDEVKGTSH